MAPTGAKLIGSITLVNEDLRFVLIDSALAPEQGAKLKALSADLTETAVLRTSPEKKPPFIIADIVSGTPHAGDRVAWTEEPQKAEPGNQTAAKLGN